MGSLKELLAPIYKVGLGDGSWHWLKDDLIEIRVSVNICGEFSYRKAERFVIEYNKKKVNEYELKFLRKYDWWSGRGTSNYSPIFYMQVQREINAIGFASNTLIKELDNFYDS